MSNGKIAGDSEVAHHCKYAYRDIYCHLDDYEKICIVCIFSIKKRGKTPEGIRNQKRFKHRPAMILMHKQTLFHTAQKVLSFCLKGQK